MFLIPRKWASFQHYKDRNPPWIKLHKELLDDRIYQRLPLASRALAPMLWLLASESKDGSFDASPEELAFRLRCSEADAEAGLAPLIEKGFFILVQSDGTPLAPREQLAAPEKRREEGETEADLLAETARRVAVAEAKKADDAAKAKAARLAAAAAADDALFEEFWKAYPKKVGKDEARKAFDKRNPTTALVAAMVEAIATARASDQWKREKGQFIPNPSTWLNQGRWKDGGVEISDEVAVDPDSRSAVEAEGVAKGIGMWNEMVEHWGAYKARVRSQSTVAA